MLDEKEYGIVHRLYGEAVESRDRHKEGMQAVCDAYAEMTGLTVTNANAVMHHRISIYGAPCGQCGKPLRTPRARFCAACGWKPSDPTE